MLKLDYPSTMNFFRISSNEKHYIQYELADEKAPQILGFSIYVIILCSLGKWRVDIERWNKNKRTEPTTFYFETEEIAREFLLKTLEEKGDKYKIKLLLKE